MTIKKNWISATITKREHVDIYLSPGKSLDYTDTIFKNELQCLAFREIIFTIELNSFAFYQSRFHFHRVL